MSGEPAVRASAATPARADRPAPAAAPALARAAAWLPAAAVAVLCLGMTLIIGGVVVPGLFMPGVYVLVLGFVAVFVAGLLAVLPRPAV